MFQETRVRDIYLQYLQFETQVFKTLAKPHVSIVLQLTFEKFFTLLKTLKIFLKTLQSNLFS